jgi:hypothetical protein
MLFVFIYVYWCPTWFPYHMMLVSLHSNTTSVTSKLIPLPENMSSSPVFSGVRVAHSLLCRSLFVSLSFFLLGIVLSVLLRFTTSDYLPLVSSNSSFKQWLLTFPSISTKRTATSHLSQVKTKKTTTHGFVNPCPGMQWERHKQMTELNRLIKCNIILSWL